MRRRVLVVDDSATLRGILTGLLRERGFDVETATDGAEALETVQGGRFDLMLVDFVMPRLNGYQLTQAIRSIPALQALPVVLLSAKAEQIGERFISQTGAAGALQKPFTPRALFEVLDRVLPTSEPDEEDPFAGLLLDEDPAPSGQGPDERFDGARTLALTNLPPGFLVGRAPPPPEPGSAVHPLPVAPATTKPPPSRQVSTSGPHPVQGPSRAAADAAHARFTELLARDLAPAFQDVTGDAAEFTEDAVLQLLRFYLSTSKVTALYRELRPLEAGLRGNVVLDGQLEAVPLGEVFQLLALQSQTGLLVVDRGGDAGDASVTFAIRNGRLDLAVGRGAGVEFLLGRYLIDAGLVTRMHVDTVAASIAGQHILFGQALVAGGFIEAADLERALEKQTCEHVYEVLRWPGGRFRFEHGSTLPEAQLARLGLPSEGLVLEGYRRLDEWRMMGEYLPSERTVLALDPSAAAGLGLTAPERRVLAAIDGVRSVRDVVDAVAMSSFDACKILYRLLQARLVSLVAA